MKNRLILLVMFCSLLFFLGCDNKAHKTQPVEKTTYTCPMHPQIIQDKSGTCPICGMDLVEFDRSGKDESLTLNENQIALANITTTVVGDTSMASQKRLNARVVTDPQGSNVISSRIAGRVDKLYIKETGIRVTKNQPLYRIYSEELATLQQEYLVAVAQKREFPDDEQFQRIERSAKQKLLLYGQSPQQINNLVKNDRPHPYTSYLAPASGVVAEILVTEGEYLQEGGTIMRLEGYEDVWIEADVYPSERSLVSEGMYVTVIVNGAPPEKMKIEFINPGLSEGSQLTRIRGKINNQQRNLQPGMQASVFIPLPGDKHTKLLPVGAVIRGHNNSHVWIETMQGKFAPRIVQTGKEDAMNVEVLDGLENGDKVVVTGSYLLYSEYVLKKGNQPVNNNTHNH